MTIDPLTAWHVDPSRYDQLLTQQTTVEFPSDQLTPAVVDAARPKRKRRRRRRLVTAAIGVPLAAATISTETSAQGGPANDWWCASSPVEVASHVIGVPPEQLGADVGAAAVHDTVLSSLEVLLIRVDLAMLDQISRLPGAGDLTAPPSDAMTDLIDGHNAVHAVLLAQTWGECTPELLTVATSLSRQAGGDEPT
jgi:hypothetical protein